MTLRKMRDWNDPLPSATAETSRQEAAPGTASASSLFSGSAAPDGAPAPLGPVPQGAADTAEAVAARILASDTLPGEGRADAAVDSVALRILNA